MSALLALENVSVAGRLAPTSLALEPGALVGLVGPNGSGKSTLLAATGGVLPCSGEVRWSDDPLEKVPALERGRRAAWVPQEARFEFGFSVRAVVAQGRFAHGDDAARVNEALARFDLDALAERPVNRLSGGERQRVLLARAWTTGAPLQLWDEPLAALDPRHALETLAIAREHARDGGALLISLHDLRLARALDRVAVLDRGRLQAYGPPAETLTPDLLREVFGVASRETPGLELYLP